MKTTHASHTVYLQFIIFLILCSYLLSKSGKYWFHFTYFQVLTSEYLQQTISVHKLRPISERCRLSNFSGLCCVIIKVDINSGIVTMNWLVLISITLAVSLRLEAATQQTCTQAICVCVLAELKFYTSFSHNICIQFLVLVPALVTLLHVVHRVQVVKLPMVTAFVVQTAIHTWTVVKMFTVLHVIWLCMHTCIHVIWLCMHTIYNYFVCESVYSCYKSNRAKNMWRDWYHRMLQWHGWYWKLWCPLQRYSKWPLLMQYLLPPEEWLLSWCSSNWLHS